MLNGMEKAAPSFKYFIRAVAPPPVDIQQKPLPPVPTRPRRPSSVYSAHNVDTYNGLETKSRLPSTEFFLQPVAFSYSNPDLNDAQAVEGPFLQPTTYVPAAKTYAEPPIFLEPRVYSPGSAGRSKDVLEQGKETTAHSDNSKKDSLRSSSETAIAEYLGFEDDVYFLPGPESLEIPVPTYTAAKKKLPVREREQSRKKAEAALGLDQKTLDEDSRRHRQHNLLNRRRHKPHAVPDRRHSAEILMPCRSSLMTDSDEEEIDESQLYLEDYHAHLGDQYRSSTTRTRKRMSDEDISNYLRLIPAPLFGKYPDRLVRGEQVKDNRKRLSKALKPNVRDSIRPPVHHRFSSLFYGKYADPAQQNIDPHAAQPVKQSSSSPTQRPPNRNQGRSHPQWGGNEPVSNSPSLSPRSNSPSPRFGFPRRKLKHTTPQTSTSKPPSPAISPRRRDPDRVGRLALALGKAKAGVAGGLEEARELFANLSFRASSDEDDSLTSMSPPISPSKYDVKAARPAQASPNPTHGSALRSDPSRSPKIDPGERERRRQELKASIRVIGNTDPAGINYARQHRRPLK